jgi:hypothetical protein
MKQRYRSRIFFATGNVFTIALLNAFFDDVSKRQEFQLSRGRPNGPEQASAEPLSKGGWRPSEFINQLCPELDMTGLIG